MAPLPVKKLFPICILLFCEAFNANQLFSYVGFMVLHFGIVDKENVGYYAGLIASSWFLAQFFSSFFWGRLSDLFGRKPILVIGSFGSFISALAFGFSWRIEFAIFARFVNGILNGNTGVAKAYIAEITDSSNQARAFGLFGLMWGLGGVCGSVLGGFASDPAVQYPSVFSSDGIFGKFPYLLPNLITAIANFIGFVSTIILVKENQVDYSSIEMDEKPSDIMILKEEVAGATDMSKIGEDEIKMSLLTNGDQQTNEDGKNVDEEVELEDDRTIEVSSDGFFQDKRSNFFSLRPLKKKLAEIRAKSEKMRTRSAKSLLTDKLVIMTCMMYAILGFYCTVYDEIMPLWVLQDVATGGLGFNSPDIGIMNSIAGAATILVQMFIYHRVANRLKLINSFLLGQVIMIPILLFIPCITFLVPYGKPVVWIALSLSVATRQFATQCAFSSVMALITNSVHFSDVGAVNGLGQSLVALLRALGPAVGASLLSWSFTNGRGFPFDHFFIFLVCLVASLIPTAMVVRLPRELNVPRNEAKRSASLKVSMAEM